MPEKISAFGIQIDPLSMTEAVQTLLEKLDSPENRCRYVVTPNVDHIVKLQQDTAFREAYQEAFLVLTDGKPVSLALRLLKKPVPQTVPGSDLIPALFSAVSQQQRGVKVFWLGGWTGIAELAAARSEARWPGVVTVGHYSPSFGFEKNGEENSKIISLINRSKPDLIVIGLGAPKQELWIHAHHHEIRGGLALCAGSTINLMAGLNKRAPHWMRSVGLEWLYRMIKNPRSLAGRYAEDAVKFPGIFLREWLQ